jgi:hypothetical protein
MSRLGFRCSPLLIGKVKKVNGGKREYEARTPGNEWQAQMLSHPAQSPEMHPSTPEQLASVTCRPRDRGLIPAALGMLPSGRLSRLETPTLPSLYGGALKPLGWLGNTHELGSRTQRAIEFFKLVMFRGSAGL